MREKRRYAKILPNPTKNQRDEMKTKTYPLRRSFLLATLASTFLLPAVQAAELIEEEEDYHAVCQEVLDKINATPDFFERVAKEGDAYVLLESPFKREDVKRIPKYSYLATVNLVDALFILGMANMSVNADNECKDYQNNPEPCDKNLSLGLPQFAESATQRHADRLEPADGLFYTTRSNLFGDPEVRERVVGHIPKQKVMGRGHPRPIFFPTRLDGIPIMADTWPMWNDFSAEYVFGRIPVDMQGKTYSMAVFLKTNPFNTEESEWDNKAFADRVYLSRLSYKKGSMGIVEYITCKIQQLH